MRSFFPLTLYCISLISLQQLLALPVGDRLDSNRLDLLQKLQGQKDEHTIAQGKNVMLASATESSPASVKPPAKWPLGFLRVTRPTDQKASQALPWAQGAVRSYTLQRTQRSRRHVHGGTRGGLHHSHHAQLMRVGCVLGTCQVQNLSHRLYQLIGQSGREDSSPINPRSPHSYG